MVNSVGIAGTDGYAPIYAPDDRWTQWSIHEIYTGQAGLNKFIPKLNDYVVEPESNTWWRVTNLDTITFIPELTPISFANNVATDVIVGEADDIYRVYFDKSVTPYTLSVDALLKVFGSAATTARLYRGSIIDNTKLISRRYDNSGNFIGNDIPLQMVAYQSTDNFAIKSIPTCNTTVEDFQDGETVSAVIFDSNGKVLSKKYLVLEETTFVPQAYAEQKFITNIYLKSPFISSMSDTDINYPVNLPMESFNPIGVVQYNDGSTVEYPIDGNKFRLYGLDSFISTIIGQSVPLVLSYRLDVNEAALATVTTDGTFITKPYNLIVSNPNTSYNVKMFVYPRWIDDINGYALDAYLMNLDRNALFDVTGMFSLASNSAAFNPLAYGVTQRLILNLDLANVSGIYNHFLHVQTVDIVLRAKASDTFATNIWEVQTQIPSTTAYYGTNLKATRDASAPTKVYVDNGAIDINDFLNKLYYPTQPLVNTLTESVPPVPTHIEVRWNGNSVIQPIENYATAFEFANTVTSLSNVQVVFLKQGPYGYLKLSVGSLTVR